MHGWFPSSYSELPDQADPGDGTLCAMPQPAEDEWVLNEAEALLDTDGRRERLDEVVADLQSGQIRPVDQVTARARIEARIASNRNW